MYLISSKIKQNSFLKKLFRLTLFLGAALLSSCAGIKPQYGKSVDAAAEKNRQPEPTAHRFFLIGDAGNADEAAAQKTLSLLKDRLDASDSASTLLFLGDNIYPNGMPSKKSAKREAAELKLQQQINITKDFKGKTFFIPGNHDWYSGLKGLNEQQEFVISQLGKNSFLPLNGCSIDSKKINNDIRLILIDSQWFLEDWDKHKNINADCSIKTRDDFFDEFESELNKYQNQLIVVAIHHPLMSNGTHGGQFSVEKQLFPLSVKIPLPGIGSLINLLRKTTGISPQDNQNQQYKNLINRMKTLLADRENVIFVSGHDHNLQYTEDGNIKQIISGAGSKTEAARAINEYDFSAGMQGYAVLDVFDDGSSKVSYYGNKDGNESLLFERNLTEKRLSFKDFIYPNDFKTTETAQIYPDELAKKSGFYKFLWGKHYRNYYSMPVEAPVLDVSNKFNGLVAIREGGGHQSNSIRLQDPFTGKEYVIRALKKSATRFLQSLAFKNQYMGDDFENTFSEGFLLDFYTTTHPYYPFVIGELADPLGIYHTNPELYFVGKQNNLGVLNQNFDEGLYMLEERPMNNFKDAENFGLPDKIVSSDKMLENLRSDEKYSLDERSYIRARLFDMLLGDWDRHDDQWRWSEFFADGKYIYKPIPRDRDQVFPKYDGLLISLLMRLPALRHMQSFGEDIRNVKWFNMEPYPMDLALIRKSNLNDWLEEAAFIQKNLTDEIIENSFRNLPGQMKDETVENIKSTLKIRKTKLDKFAKAYYNVLRKTVVLTSTDKDDKILVERLPGGKTKVSMYRLKKSGEELFFENTYNHKETKDIWLYGLNAADEFEILGNGNAPIRLRLIGGEGNDIYKISDGRKVCIYDHPNEKNEYKDAKTAKLHLTEDYSLNRYDMFKPAYNSYSGLPSVGYNPDDGVELGIAFNYKINGFKRDKYTANHKLTLNYYFATNGFEAIYTGDFVKFAGKWNLGLDARFTSPAYTHNFFGYGNTTKNFDDQLGMDFNRIKIQSFSFKPSLYKTGINNGKTEFTFGISDLKVARTKDRITGFTSEIPDEVFEHNYIGEAAAKYSFSNYDNRSMPALGMHFSAEARIEKNFSRSTAVLPILEGSLGFVHPISRNGILNISSTLNGKILLDNEFEFYQAASIGQTTGLRAYRFDRFMGKESFVQTSDLNLRLGKLKTPLLPVYIGVFGGFDYGRVWMPGEKSNKWHQSYGGGIWLNAVKTLTGKINLFTGEDGTRFSFNLVLGF